VMAAAVADFRPMTQAADKIKKADIEPDPIVLTKNPDILGELVTARADGRLNTAVIVGFAAETGDANADVLTHGRAKLRRKGCDLLVVNSVADGLVFGREDNAAVILAATGTETSVELGPKAVLAAAVCDAIARLLTS
jgi:phosphopantothenoylcysteine decarboxylase/phosphopantothenate--cysteine ligase